MAVVIVVPGYCMRASAGLWCPLCDIGFKDLAELKSCRVLKVSTQILKEGLGGQSVCDRV
jgi:hypothetical protein